MTSKNSSLNLLVEIGAEELPLSALDLIFSDFKASFSKLLERERINFSAIEVEATPRRIAFFVSNLSAKQQDLKLEISGPSAEKAYDAAGKPTQALLGFMKSKEITEKDIEAKLKKVINSDFVENLFFNLNSNPEFKQFFNHDKNDEWAPFNIHKWTNNLDDNLTKIIQVSLLNFWLNENLTDKAHNIPLVKI